ncbi:MAG TPA: hypothetical protein ENI68_12950 [Gammaproteobacteria bacterium]|nr:hypothetical protein [Gammaproteobacteria bacterium]
MTNPIQRSPMAYIGMVVVALLAITVLVGCVKRAPTFDTALTVQNATIMENDPYKKTNWIKGPLVNCGGQCEMFLRSWVSDGSASVFYQLYVNDDDFEWRFFDSAYDMNGTKMDFIILDRQTRMGYGYARTIETFAIFLEKKYMNRAKTEGLNFKVSGKRGTKVFTLPPHYVQGFMSVVAQRFPSRGVIGKPQNSNPVSASVSAPPLVKQPSAMGQQPTAIGQQPSPTEMHYWEQVKDSRNPAQFDAYLVMFPNSQMAPLARRRLDELRVSQ